VVIAAPVLIGLIALVLVVAYLALQKAADAWLKPLLQWIFAPRQSFWAKVLIWPVHEIGHGLKALQRYVLRVLGAAYFLAAAALGRFFHAYAYVLDELLVGAEAFARDVAKAFDYTRHVLIPTLIETALRPLRADVVLAKALATAATTTLTGISVEFAAGLRSLPWGVPQGIVARVAAFWNAFAHLWDQVFRHVVPRLDLIQYTTLPRIAGRLDDVWNDLYRTGRDSITGIRTRLRTLESAIGGVDTAAWWQAGVLAAIAALAGVTIAVVRTGIRSLFCRNTRGVAQKLCGMDEALIAGLLAGTLGFALLLDPKLVARTGQTIEGQIDHAIRTMAGL
jgi:hypothetical protein